MQCEVKIKFVQLKIKKMEFIYFKIYPNKRRVFDQAFKDILQESEINCNQWGYDEGEVFTNVKIPKYAVDKMTPEQIELLKSFI